MQTAVEHADGDVCVDDAAHLIVVLVQMLCFVTVRIFAHMLWQRQLRNVRENRIEAPFQCVSVAFACALDKHLHSLQSGHEDMMIACCLDQIDQFEDHVLDVAAAGNLDE